MGIFSIKRGRMAIRLPLLLAFAVFFGCRGEPDGRVEVAGKVTFDGQPLTTGNVTFVSTDGGTSSGARISDGEFHLPSARGLGPGIYRVRIVSFQPTGKQIPDDDNPGQMIEETRQVIPPQYNSKTELTVKIPEEASDALLFELQS